MEKSVENVERLVGIQIQNFYLGLHQVTKNCVVLRQRHSEGGSLRANARRRGTLKGGALTQSKLNARSHQKFFLGLMFMTLRRVIIGKCAKIFRYGDAGIQNHIT